MKRAAGPIQLLSVELEPAGKDLLLTFRPDLMPFDVDDLSLTFQFYERGPAGLVEAGFAPTIDWSSWKIPVLGNKPRQLRLSSLGAFDQLKTEIHYKSVVIDSRLFICK